MAISRTSSSVETIVSEAESCSFVMMIKNTFISLSDSEDSSPRTLRRSASAPPQTREKADDSLFQSTPSKFSSASLSTASGDETEDEIASSDGGVTLDTGRFSTTSSSEGTALALANLVPERSSLRSLAPAWAPPEQTRPGLPPEVQSAFAEIVLAGQNALRCCPCVVKVENTQHAGGWAVIGTVPQAQFQQVQPSLATMQKVMLRAAEVSANAYIIGYDAAPFAPAGPGHFGFRTQLALVQDESSACWDLLSKGYCHRGCACRWQHPSWQATVDVTILFVEVPTTVSGAR